MYHLPMMKINLNLSLLEGLEVQTTTERCLILIGEKVRGGWNVDALGEIPNRHPRPADQYRVIAKDVYELLGNRRSDRVIGALHTHCEWHPADPSDHDIELMPKGFLGIVYHPKTLTVSYYDRRGLINQFINDQTRSKA